MTTNETMHSLHDNGETPFDSAIHSITGETVSDRKSVV